MTTYSMLQSATQSILKLLITLTTMSIASYTILGSQATRVIYTDWADHTETYTFNCSVLCTVISSVQYLAGQAVISIIILIIPIHHQNIPTACYVTGHSPQLESPLPRCFMMRFCIQNASQRHCRVTWSQTPWPVWH